MFGMWGGNEKLTKSYLGSFTYDKFEEYFSSSELLMQFLDSNAYDEEHPKITIIDDPSKRMEAVKEYAKKHKAQIYTEVDLDSGETGYSKGVRICNTFNQGLYAVVKIEGLEVDNS